LLIKIDPERESGEGDMRFDCAGRGFAKVLSSVVSSVARRLAEGAEPVKHSLEHCSYHQHYSERCLGAADSIASRIPPGQNWLVV